MDDVFVQFKEWPCKIERGQYRGGITALKLIHATEGDPVAVATVNIDGRYPPEGHVFIKNWSENEGMVAALERAGVVKDTGHKVKVGDVEAHLCKLLV